MSVTSNQPSPLHASPWDEVVRIYRRICVLRANGQTEEATRVQRVELAHAVTFAQEMAGREPELRLPALFAAEEERVANAKVLADLLAPLLVEKLRTQVVAPLPPAIPAKREAPAVATATSAAAFVPQETSPGGPPSVADLIDGMLAQERRASGNTLRRAAGF